MANKILIFSDIHWSNTTSIVKSHGQKYTKRLELLIDTMNWINRVAVEQNCSMLICAGDMMDRSNLVDQELTALKEIDWCDKPCYFLCGNHESSVDDLRFNTVSALLDKTTCSNIAETGTGKFHVIVNPCELGLKDTQSTLYFLPYIDEFNRRPLKEYFDFKNCKTKNRIIISHNDLKGVSYGPMVSQEGFSTDEILENSELFLNGHIHNSKFIVPNRLLNVGSSSAQNFTNDSLNYAYGIWILDVDTLNLQFIENPYSLNFYKFDIRTMEDLKAFEHYFIYDSVGQTKNNLVLSIVYNALDTTLTDTLLKFLTEPDFKSRLTTEPRLTQLDRTDIVEQVDKVVEFSVDHIKMFNDAVHKLIGDNALINTELKQLFE